MPAEVLTVSEFRIVVQDQLEAMYLSAYELPLVRAIERSKCEDVLVDCYRAAAVAVLERDLCHHTLARFESAIDLLLAVDTADDPPTRDDTGQP